jgi:hypothetical protein
MEKTRRLRLACTDMQRQEYGDWRDTSHQSIRSSSHALWKYTRGKRIRRRSAGAWYNTTGQIELGRRLESEQGRRKLVNHDIGLINLEQNKKRCHTTLYHSELRRYRQLWQV